MTPDSTPCWRHGSVPYWLVALMWTWEDHGRKWEMWMRRSRGSRVMWAYRPKLLIVRGEKSSFFPFHIPNGVLIQRAKFQMLVLVLKTTHALVIITVTKKTLLKRLMKTHKIIKTAVHSILLPLRLLWTVLNKPSTLYSVFYKYLLSALSLGNVVSRNPG